MRLFLFLTLSASAWAAAPDAKGIVERALLKDTRNNELLEKYTYVQAETERQLDAAGKVTSTTSKDFEVQRIYGIQHKTLVKKDGKPLPLKEQAAEKDRVDKLAARQARLSVTEREKQANDEAAKRRKRREFLKDIPKAYDFQVVGEETVAGRPSWVIEATPRSGYAATSMQTRVFKKMKAKFWIAKEIDQIVRMEAEATDTVSFGFVLARLNKGSRLTLELMHVNNELWVPRMFRADVDARLALVKKVRASEEVQFSNFRKFSAESRVLPHSGQPEPSPTIFPPK